MRSFDKYRNTRYLQKTEVGKGILVTIAKITEENVAPDDQPEEIKYVLHFREKYKPWVPNIGSLDEIRAMTGSDDVDQWTGTCIVLYVNPDVEMKGKRVGGIRCRTPKPGYSAQQQISLPKPNFRNESQIIDVEESEGTDSRDESSVVGDDDIPF